MGTRKHAISFSSVKNIYYLINAKEYLLIHLLEKFFTGPFPQMKKP